MLVAHGLTFHGKNGVVAGKGLALHFVKGKCMLLMMRKLIHFVKKARIKSAEKVVANNCFRKKKKL